MLKTLPSTDLYVLDALGNLYDHYGEEKAISFDKITMEIHKYCKKYGITKIDQQQLINCLDELEYYSFIEVLKKSIKIKV